VRSDYVACGLEFAELVGGHIQFVPVDVGGRQPLNKFIQQPLPVIVGDIEVEDTFDERRPIGILLPSIGLFTSPR
jgi:hypothetical protein